MPAHSADEAIRSGITGPDAGTARRAGRTRGLRGNSLGISLMLIAEYGLGIGVNLYVRVPAADRGNGLASAVGRALTSQPVLLAIHAGLGLLLLFAAVNVLIRAIRARHRFAIAASVTGLLAITSAAVSGANFVSDSKAAASMAMAVMTGIALMCYLGNLFAVPPAAPR